MRLPRLALAAIPVLACFLTTDALAQIRAVSLVQNLAYPLGVAHADSRSTRITLLR